MGTLKLKLGFKSGVMQNLDLPVEIRKPNSALVARTLASKPVEGLKPGRYYASAALPGGQHLFETFVMSDQDLTVELAPEPEDASPHEWEEATHYLQTPNALDLDRLNASIGIAADTFSPFKGAADFDARFRLFAGNPITGPTRLLPLGSGLKLDDFDKGRVVQFGVERSGDPIIVQLVEPGSPAQNMVVPVAPGRDALLTFTRSLDGACHMDVHVENPTADMLLRYTSESATTQAGEASRSAMIDAEQVLYAKYQDPVAAAVGACAILRLGELKWLHEWTANLDASFPWFPDGAAIRGEHLARLGRHLEAAERFFEVPARGLPLCIDALFYTVERLKWYGALATEHASGIDRERAREELAKLHPFATFAERHRPVTRYLGTDPAVPGDELPPPGPLPEAIELSEWLGDADTPAPSFGGPAASKPPNENAPPSISFGG